MSKIRDDGPTFAELKQNVFFTEKRLALLLESKFHTEMNYWVTEKGIVRAECKNECIKWIEELENCIAGKMRGLWHAMRIVQAFNVEVNLQALVGSEWYEQPKPAATHDAAALIARIRELGSLVPGTPNVTSAEAVAELIQRFEGIDWSAQEMARFFEALRAKERLLLEVAELTKTLQEVAWGCSSHEAKKEELRRKAGDAMRQGEIDLYAQYSQDEVAASEASMQLLLFKLQTTESSQTENTMNRRNNVSQWKLAAAQLETLKENKVVRQSECARDRERIARGLEYEAKKDDEARQDFTKRKKQFEDRLAYLNRTQDELTGELEDLCEKFKVIEDKLGALTEHREDAIKARVDMIETEMQRVADYQEFVQCAKKHASYIDSTQRMAEESTSLIDTLQRFLMNEQGYDEHDFHATTKLLNDTKTQALHQLNTCYVDYCTRVHRLARQLDAQVREVEAEARCYQMQAECAKETLNPEAKRYIVAAKAALAKRGVLQQQRADILAKLDFAKANYLTKVIEGLPAHEVAEPEAAIEEELLNRRDDLLTMREQLAVSERENILDERECLLATSDRIAEEKEAGANRLVQREPRAVQKLRDHVDGAVDAQVSLDPAEVAAANITGEVVAELEAAGGAVGLPAGASEHRREHRIVAAAHDARIESLAAVPDSDPSGKAVLQPAEDPAHRKAKLHELSVTSEPRTIRALEAKYGQGMFPEIGNNG